jgi:hypothetical protein
VGKYTQEMKHPWVDRIAEFRLIFILLKISENFECPVIKPVMYFVIKKLSSIFFNQ